jgi:hypothetical protein
MNRSLLSYSLGAALLTLGVAACSSDSTSPSTSVTQAQEQTDVATAAGDATGEDVALMYATYANASGANVSEAAAAGRVSGLQASAESDEDEWHLGAPCPYDADTGRHLCPTVTNGQGLSLSSSYAFFDGTIPQQSFDASTTTSINFQANLFGTVTGFSWTASVDRTRDLTVAAGGNGWSVSRIWNGSGSGSLSAESDGGNLSRSYRLNSSTTITNVTVAEPRSENPWPLSGSITHVFDGTRTREGARTVSRTVSYTATITFNGTSTVPLDMGSTQFCVDLATRQLVDVTCR